MTTIKHLALALALLLTAVASLKAQNVKDIANYSLWEPSVTARSLAVGNAMGAVGGDLYALHSNPAGIALCRGLDFSVGASTFYNHTQSNFMGSVLNSSKLKFGFDGTGGIFTVHLNRDSEQRGVISLHFGIDYSTLRHYGGVDRLSARTQDGNSFAKGLAEASNAAKLVPEDFVSNDAYDAYAKQDWNAVQAYDTYFITDDATWETNPDGSYKKDANGNYNRIAWYDFKSQWAADEPLEQTRQAENTGALRELSLAFGLNISHMVYVGSALGIQVSNHDWTQTYQESTLLPNKSKGLRSATFTQKITERGSGINFKLGVIVRANDYLRFGIAFHTPTYMRMNTTFDLFTKTEFLSYDLPWYPNGSNTSVHSPNGRDSYTFISPLRLQASAAIFLEKYAFIDFDYEMDYLPLASFEDAQRFGQVNQAIQDAAKPIHEFRLGVEGNIGFLGLRFGGGYRLPIFTDGLAPLQMSRWYVSGGVGFNFTAIYFDLAYRHSGGSYSDLLYSVGGYDREFSQYEQRGQFIMTLGIAFN